MFEITITKKVITKKKADFEDITVSEAISTIYNYSKDFIIFINWNGFKLPIDGVGFSQIYNDIIIMLEELEEGCDFSVNFLDSGFTAIWKFTTKGHFIDVEAEWVDIASYGYEKTTIEELEKVSNVITVNKREFIKEWNSLLKIIKDDLINAGYDETLDGFEYLKAL
ncbi:hypothetical protein ABXT08_07245 [Chryseobacterium sp. NRRL B-14859]|uniref:hypothetical protein n=1 Tax=Chryseobacterium sp. NRRL B-14859 TaxID=1562763 RepID=UPI0033970D36